ncbi:Uncharacterised protein [Chlamydia trachomatis]|nr:Uncharacterised protein [Chlamydia trachomatis]
MRWQLELDVANKLKPRQAQQVVVSHARRHVHTAKRPGHKPIVGRPRVVNRRDRHGHTLLGARAQGSADLFDERNPLLLLRGRWRDVRDRSRPSGRGADVGLASKRITGRLCERARTPLPWHAPATSRFLGKRGARHRRILHDVVRPPLMHVNRVGKKVRICGSSVHCADHRACACVDNLHVSRPASQVSQVGGPLLTGGVPVPADWSFAKVALVGKLACKKWERGSKQRQIFTICALKRQRDFRGRRTQMRRQHPRVGGIDDVCFDGGKNLIWVVNKVFIHRIIGRNQNRNALCPCAPRATNLLPERRARPRPACSHRRVQTGNIEPQLQSRRGGNRTQSPASQR